VVENVYRNSFVTRDDGYLGNVKEMTFFKQNVVWFQKGDLCDHYLFVPRAGNDRKEMSLKQKLAK
jgi:hypothetical protein